MAQLTGGRYGNLLIGPKLETEGIELEGTQRDLEALSVGTREQLATVLRLTIADVLGSTVVLDDQLVQSDASRMDWLRAFMVECADRFQILVFTCHPEEYKSGRASEEVGIQVDRPCWMPKAFTVMTVASPQRDGHGQLQGRVLRRGLREAMYAC